MTMQHRIILVVFILLSVGADVLTAQTMEEFKTDAGKAIQLINAEKFDEAKPVIETLKIQAKEVFSNEGDAALMFFDLGVACQRAGKLDQAVECLQLAVLIDENAFGKGATLVADDLYRLAYFHHLGDAPVEAENCFKRALDIYETNRGDDHDLTISTRDWLAKLCCSNGKYHEAESLYRKALKVVEKLHGKDHLQTAIALSNLAMLYYRQDRHEDSETENKRVLEIAGKNHEEKPMEIVSCLNVLADNFYAQKRYAEAESLYQKVFEICMRELGTDHVQTAQALNSIGSTFRDRKQYGEAEKYYKNAVEIFEKVLEKNDPEKIASSSNLADVYFKQKRFKESEGTYRLILKLQEINQGMDSLAVANVLDKIGFCLNAQELYEDAEAIFRRSLEICEKRLGTDRFRTAISFVNIGSMLYKRKRYDEAEPFFKKAVEIAERIVDKDDPSMIVIYRNLANNYTNQHRYSEAEPLYKRALQISERLEDHSETVLLLNKLTSLYLDEQSMPIRGSIEDDSETAALLSKLAKFNDGQGCYAKAEPLYKRALQIHEKTDKESSVTAQSLTDLAELYLTEGRYAEAEPLYKRALRIHEKINANSPDTAQSLANLAKLYLAQGRFAEAKPLCESSVQIWEKIDEDHLKTAEAKYTLASIYDAQKNYKDAEPLYLRSLKIREEKLGEGNSEMVRSLIGLLWLYETQGRQTEAKPYYERYEKSLRPWEYIYKGPETVRSLINLATLYKVQQSYSMAEILCLQSLRMCAEELGEDHPLMAESLNSMAELYYLQGCDHVRGRTSDKNVFIDTSFIETELPYHKARFARAQSYFDSALEIFEKSRSAADLRQNCYYNRALLYTETSHPQEAVADLKKAMTLTLEVRQHVSGSDEQRAETFAGYYGLFETMVDWQYEFSKNDPKLYEVDEVYDAMERSRCRGLQDLIDSQRVDLLKGIDPETATQLRAEEQGAKIALKSVEKDFERYVTQKRDEAEIKRKETALRNAQKRLIDAQAAIKNVSPIYRETIGKGEAEPFANVQKRLQSTKSLALEYLVGNKKSYLLVYGASQETKLFPLELDASQSALFGVEAGPLSSAKMLEIFQNKNNGGVMQVVTDRNQSRIMENKIPDKDLVDKLAALWKILVPSETLRNDLLAERNDVKQLVILPDGPLASFPFEMLIVNTDANQPEYLLQKGPAILYSPSANIYFKLGDFSNRPIFDTKKVLAVGNPLYEKDSDDKAKKKDASNLEKGDLYANRFQLDNFRRSSEETENVKNAFAASGMTVCRFDGAESTEKNVRENVSGSKIILFSCHGICDDYFGNMFGCLALTVGDRNVEKNDGFLELREMMELDLKSCELVMLSACSTNLGTNQRGEGTWALTRGMLVAGSRRVFTTDWKVQEDVSCNLISNFAVRLNDKDHSDYASELRKVKCDLLTKRPHPYFWAPFVLVGVP